MLEQSVRGLSGKLRHWVWLVGLLGSTSCSSEPRDARVFGAPKDELARGMRYLSDAEYRRRELVDSLVNADNGYSRLRLERYTERSWGSLPEWNPRTSGADVKSSEAPAGTSDAWSRLRVDEVPWQRDALLALGREAFFRYPVQVFLPLKRVLGGAISGSSYGFWVEGSELGGAVWTELPSGQMATALTCSGCHGSADSGRVIAGRNNADLDLEALQLDYYDAKGSVSASGRAGRLDVTGDGLDNPTAITDLRAVRSQRHLHRAATLKNGLIPLAVRIETLIITSLEEAARPPRKVAFALALYVWNLEPEPVGVAGETAARGQALFYAQCAGCHQPPDFSGPSVALEVVGTDRTVGDSPDRFTGSYRVPSLRGVGDRRRLFANGAVTDARELLDPARSAPGHRFGLDLQAAERESLLAYLQTL